MIDRAAYRLFAIVAVVAVLASIAAAFWALSGDSEVTIEGAMALGFGVLVTVLLGGGLMTAVFLSDRTGRDR
jgi:hypothetical protein